MVQIFKGVGKKKQLPTLVLGVRRPPMQVLAVRRPPCYCRQLQKAALAFAVTTLAAEFAFQTLFVVGGAGNAWLAQYPAQAGQVHEAQAQAQWARTAAALGTLHAHRPASAARHLALLVLLSTAFLLVQTKLVLQLRKNVQGLEKPIRRAQVLSALWSAFVVFGYLTQLDDNRQPIASVFIYAVALTSCTMLLWRLQRLQAVRRAAGAAADTCCAANSAGAAIIVDI